MSYEFFRQKFGWTDSVTKLRQMSEELRYYLSLESPYCDLIQDLLKNIKDLLLSTSLSDVEEKNVTFGIRVGVGGAESKDFLDELFKMYFHYCTFMRWQVSDILQPSSGFIKCIISGPKVYKFLRLEAGIHRVQRVPRTEKSGRYHTSTVSIFVIPSVYDEVDIKIKPSDIRIDTFRAGGKGGQHVNVTDSAVRVVHLPTGITVSCQQERSQAANKKIALEELRRKVIDAEYLAINREIGEKVSSQIGSGTRNEKIRTYDFKDDTLVDHRVGIKMKRLDDIIVGEGKLLSFLSEVLLQYELRFFAIKQAYDQALKVCK